MKNRITFRKPMVQILVPEGWTARYDSGLDLVIIHPSDEGIGDDNDAIVHFVALQELTTQRSWVTEVEERMRRRLGDAPLALEGRNLGGRRCLWSEWTDGVATIESWFVAPSVKFPLVEVSAGFLVFSQQESWVKSLHGIVESIRWPRDE